MIQLFMIFGCNCWNNPRAAGTELPPSKSKKKSIAQTFFHLINMQGRTHRSSPAPSRFNTLLQLLNYVARQAAAAVVAWQLGIPYSIVIDGEDWFTDSPRVQLQHAALTFK